MIWRLSTITHAGNVKFIYYLYHEHINCMTSLQYVLSGVVHRSLLSEILAASIPFVRFLSSMYSLVICQMMFTVNALSQVSHLYGFATVWSLR